MTMKNIGKYIVRFHEYKEGTGYTQICVVAEDASEELQISIEKAMNKLKEVSETCKESYATS